MTLTSLITKALPFLLLCTTFFSCRDGGRTESILRTADSLMEGHPDSALSILRRDSLEICRSGKDYRLWYALSRTEADDKCYILHVSDSTMRAAANYYDSHGSALQRVRADYLLGRVYCDMHLYGHALASFNKAIAVDAENDSVINRYKARSATWAGYVYEAKGLHKDALRYNKLAYGYAKQAGAQVTEVYSLRDIGRSYSYLKQNNTAIPYYRHAAKKAKAIGDANLYNMVMEELAGIYIEEGQLDDAYSALNTPFLATTDKDISSHYYVWAYYFEHTGQLDSAVAYNKRGMSYSNNTEKRDACLDIIRILNKQGKRDEAMEYYDKYSVYSDSVTASELNETSDMLSQVEKNIDIERKNTVLAETKTNLTILLSVIIFTVIVVSLILIKHYSNVKKRIREQQERANNYLSQLQETEMQKMKRNEERIAQLETELSVSNEKLTEIRKSLMRNEAEMLAKQNEHMLFKEKHRELLIADLADTDVYKLYHTPNAVPSSADYHRLVEALNKAYNNFTKRLKEFYPDINDNEVWICCMVKAGLSSKEICNISPYSYSSLGMAKSRLYFKMFQKKGGAKDLDHFIKEL
ncbi:tPR-repeat-containing protein [Prevotella sp. CAG:255]|uniref:tPR-repeat-containing protein n=1 Tax=Prevotella sp. CAG:255 TaxID=1262923 RepID=UPI00033DECB5|nr:tPR-repeat-containing protein [Prevotella sp. CAG:255]CCX69796.1 tPR-repeat-containing protein [Prevotella sp. CAG:255]